MLILTIGKPQVEEIDAAQAISAQATHLGMYCIIIIITYLYTDLGIVLHML